MMCNLVIQLLPRGVTSMIIPQRKAYSQKSMVSANLNRIGSTSQIFLRAPSLLCPKSKVCSEQRLIVPVALLGGAVDVIGGIGSHAECKVRP